MSIIAQLHVEVVCDCVPPRHLYRPSEGCGKGWQHNAVAVGDGVFIGVLGPDGVWRLKDTLTVVYEIDYEAQKRRERIIAYESPDKVKPDRVELRWLINGRVDRTFKPTDVLPLVIADIKQAPDVSATAAEWLTTFTNAVTTLLREQEQEDT